MDQPSIDRLLVDEAVAIDAATCRDDYRTYCERAWSLLVPDGRPFIRNRGSDAIIEHMQAVADGKIRRLGIAVAPGFGKSTLTSVAFTSWMWTRMPAWKVICASHTYSLATDLAKKAMRVVRSPWYRSRFPDVELDGEAIDSFTTSAGGQRYALGVDQATTGKRCHCAIIDDSLSANDAHSDKQIQHVNNWADHTISTRLDYPDTAPTVVIQQRLAELDLLGHLFKRGAWEELVLPSEYESDRRCVTNIWQDPRTSEGELLAPDLHSQKFLDEQKIVLGPYGFAAQYQQRPAPAAGGMFRKEWFGRFTLTDIGMRKSLRGEVLDLDWMTISVDATFGSVKQDADNVGLLVVGGKGPKRYVFDDASRRMTFLETCAAVKAMVVAYPLVAKVLLEQSANGPAVAESLRAAINDGKMRAVVVELVTTHLLGNKTARAHAMVPQIAAGLVRLLDGAAWGDAFVAEHTMFGGGAAHDDRVDALGQLLAYYDEPDPLTKFKRLSAL